MNVVAQVLDPAELIACVRARVAALDVPHVELEEHMALTRGLLGKFLGPAERRRIGLTNICQVLEGIGYRMIIVEHLDHAAVLDELADKTRPRQRAGPRGQLRMKLSPAVIKAAASELGAKGGRRPKRFGSRHQSKAGKARWHGLTKAQRAEIARKAARAQWGNAGVGRKVARGLVQRVGE